MYQVSTYQTEDGREPFQDWLKALSDRQARARILTRLERMEAGNFGDCKPITGGVWELKIDYGPGYRVYYSRVQGKVVLLLVGGDKRKQQSDIDTALVYLEDWKERKGHE
jgi:putative addiction module killer protein